MPALLRQIICAVPPGKLPKYSFTHRLNFGGFCNLRKNSRNKARVKTEICA